MQPADARRGGARLQGGPEFVLGHTGLFEHSAQRAGTDFLVHGHHAAAVGAPQDGVTALLAEEGEAKSFESFAGFRTGNQRELSSPLMK